MATCTQQLTWHLSKADLQELLQEAGTNYTVLEFKMCIDSSGSTNYYMSLINDNAPQALPAAEAANVAPTEKRACPVPPGCN